MITDENLPDGWSAASEREEYDEMMDREYESRRFVREDGEAAVSVNEVQEPDVFQGWGYQVIGKTGDGTEEELGLFEEAEDAREAAIEYMSDHGA